MLDELKIDELLEKVDSRYGLVLATARRARQINEYTATLGLNESLGIPGPQVHTRSQHPLSIAIEELREGKLRIGFKTDAAPEPAARRDEQADPVAEEAAGEGAASAGMTGAEEPAPEESGEVAADARPEEESEIEAGAAPPEEGGSEDGGPEEGGSEEDQGAA